MFYYKLYRNNSEGIKMVYVYLKDGNVYSYSVPNMQKAREHMHKIWEGGYRTTVGGKLTWFGPHWIDKIVYQGDDVDSNHKDKVNATL